MDYLVLAVLVAIYGSMCSAVFKASKHHRAVRNDGDFVSIDMLDQLMLNARKNQMAEAMLQSTKSASKVFAI